MKKKRAFTLLEIMIVIFLIGLIGSVIGYNMKGSLDEGKAFKTSQAITRVTDLLELEIAKGGDLDEIKGDTQAYLKKTGLIKNVKQTMKDGWGNKLDIEITDSGEVIVTSKKYDDYLASKPDYNRDDEEE